MHRIDPLTALLLTLREESDTSNRAAERRDGEATRASDLEVCAHADRFLATLDVDSSVGMWFDAFADAFPSRRDAAIAYVRELGFGPVDVASAKTSHIGAKDRR